LDQSIQLLGKEVWIEVEELSEPGGRAKTETKPVQATSEAHASIETWVKNLLSSDYLVRLEAVGQLKRHGREAAEAVLQLALRSADIAVFPALSHALEEFGRPAADAILQGLGAIEVRREREVYLVECLIDALRTSWSPRAAAAVDSQVVKFNAVIARNGNASMGALCRHAKIKAIATLGEFGDRRRLPELVALLEQGLGTMHPEVISALANAGDRQAVAALVKSLETVDSLALQQEIKEAVRRIARREKATADDAAFAGLAEAQKSLLLKILPRARVANGRSG
jgi:HEAT repeat protein